MEPQIASSSSGKILDIEILRAVAVISVLFYHIHINLLNAEPLLGGFLRRHFGGWVGVDLFFAISGFVIARKLLPALAASNSNAEYRRISYRFWGKRFFRLLPSAWSWLGVILLLQMFFNQSGAFGGLKENLWATLAAVLNYANFRFAYSFKSFPYGVSFVYWSLSLEEQFYLLLPLIFFISRKYKYLTAMLLLVILWQLPQQRSFLGMAVRSDAICLGILIAIFSKKELYQRLHPGQSGLLHHVYTIIVVGVLAVLPILGMADQQQIHFKIGAIAVLSAIVVFCCSFDTNLLNRFPGSRMFIWVGSRSYGIYLIHIPAYFAIRELAYRTDYSLQDNPYVAILSAFCLVFLLAELNYRLIEMPAIRFSKSFFKPAVSVK